MFGSSKNENGQLTIAGIPAVDLAKNYGTPLFCLDESLIRDKCRRYTGAFCTNNNNRVAYAGKALLTVAICQLINEEGLCLDVVSGGELHTAMTASFPAEKIYFHGNNKSRAELTMAMEYGVGTIVVDNLFELSLLDELSRERQQEVNILFRVALGVDTVTHKYIQTGQHDSKFGFAVNSSQFSEAISFTLNHPYINLQGYHSHIGSQILVLSGFSQAVDVMYDLVETNMKKFGFTPVQINLGGGLGIKYTDEQDSPIEELIDIVLKRAMEHNARLGIDPVLVMEPGRSIMGNAGTTLYTIGAVKEVKDIRTFVSVDGGMTDNPRPALYQAKYECVVANKMDDEQTNTYSIAGKCCESGDMLIWDVKLPTVQSGDILAVFSTGAYNYSMASNYNRIPRPAVVLVNNGESRVIVERETYADVVSRDKPLKD